MMMRFRFAAVLSLGLAGCLSTVVEPLSLVSREALTVTPATPARIVWLLDKSGSMNAPVDASNPLCGDCGPSNPCPLGCPTRKDWLAGWLGRQTFDVAQHTSIYYPIDNICGPPEASTSHTSTLTISAEWGRVHPSGGTPTSLALEFAATSTLPDPSSDTYIVLVTDGVPNCNPENPANMCSGAKTCLCTVASCAGSNFCALGCLDDQGVVAASNHVAALGLKLLVVGVRGSGLTDSIAAAPQALNAMNINLPPLCSTNTDCSSGGTCDATTKTCSNRFFYGATDAELAPAVTRLTKAIAETKTCLFTTAPGSLTAEAEVSLGGSLVPSSQYTIEGTNRIRFTGDACATRLAAPALNVSVTMPGR